MSTRRDPVRVLQQRALDGSITVVELHGLAGRERAVEFRGKDAEGATRLVAQVRRDLGASVVGFAEAANERPCPRCGARAGTAGLDGMFGFRTVRGKRIRQSWCRSCRGALTSRPAEQAHPS